MVTGWSYFVASKGVPASCISCTSTFPREVTRIEISPMVPGFTSGRGGSTVTVPFQVPASAFSCEKDFLPSDCGWVADVCISCWASATVARSSRAKRITGRRVLMSISPQNVWSQDQALAAILLYLTITLEDVKLFLAVGLNLAFGASE